MAEFCLDCLNRMDDSSDPPEEYVRSRKLERCDACGEMKKIVICGRSGLLRRLRLLPALLIGDMIFELRRLLRKKR